MLGNWALEVWLRPWQAIHLLFRKGRRVVRLKSGDPGIFSRATEEFEAARNAGVAVEIVRGVTAASAAGAVMVRSLTERGSTDTLILSTGTGQSPDQLTDCSRFAEAGTTTALYMCVRKADRIDATLRARGPVGRNAGRDLCRCLKTNLSGARPFLAAGSSSVLHVG